MISAYTILKRYVLATSLAMTALLLVPSAASFAQVPPPPVTYTVTTLTDELDASTDPLLGTGTSLREAIEYSVADDVIDFQNGLIGTIFLQKSLGEIVISHDLFIYGPGSSTIEVNGNDKMRILSIASGVEVEISALTLSSGRIMDGGDGAAIKSEGALSISNTVIRWSTALNSGGAIYHDGDALQLDSCSFERCEAYVNGGAVAVMGGTLSAMGTSFTGNTARGSGGGLYLDNSVANILTDLSLSGNTALVNGGAISVLAGTTLGFITSTVNDNDARNGAGIHNTGILNLLSCTISGNTASEQGGGVFTSQTLTSNFSTIAFNSAKIGGGVFNSSAFAPKNSLFAENTAPEGPNVYGGAASASAGGHNLISSSDGSTGWISNDVTGTVDMPVEASLDALHFNGGATKTHALLVCSAAIDAAAFTPLTLDQRGMPRTMQGDNYLGAKPDIGAFEAQSPLDTEVPVINTISLPNPGDKISFYLDASGQKSVYVRDLGYLTDNCGVIDSTVGLAGGAVSLPYFTAAHLGTRTLTIRATDRSHNYAARNINVEVIDLIAPVLTIPADVTADASSTSCGRTKASLSLGTATATDNCGGGTVGAPTNNAPTVFPVGLTIVTWEAEDASGNTVTGAQMVNIIDNTAPTIAAPANVSVNTTGGECAVGLTTATLGTPTFSDNCTLSSVVISNNAPAKFPVGATTTVTWYAKDAAGNMSSANQQVTIVDVTPPMLAAPPDITLPSDPGSCDRAGGNVALGSETAVDCSGVTVVNDKPASFPIGETIVTWTATDGHSNITTAFQKVTIVDLSPPTVVAPPEIAVDVDPGTCAWTVDPLVLGTATSVDNCSAPNVTNSAGTSLGVGRHRVIWTAVDGDGNLMTDVQIVTVTGEAPTISCISDTTVNTDPGKAGAYVTFVPPTAGSSCSAIEVLRTSGLGSGDFFPVGTTNVEYMAIDGSNQIAICDFDVIVEDNEAPQISVAVSPRNLWPADNKMYEIEAIVVVTDNVPGAAAVLTSVTCNQNANGDIAGVTTNWLDLNYEFRASRNSGPRVYTVLYTATDVAGNWSTGQATVTVPTVKPKDVEGEELPVPTSVSLAQNYPNPFNPSTLISFGTPVEQHIELQIFNAMGMPVRTLISSQVAAGSYTVEWDGHDDNGRPVSTGVYLYMLRGGDVHLERKMILAR